MKIRSPAPGHYDEMLLPDGSLRPHYREYGQWLEGADEAWLAQRRKEADLLFHRVGITFTVYGDERGAERLIPFDSLPRIIPADEWQRLQAGLLQRVRALNHFLRDIYHEQHIVRAGVVPAEQVFTNSEYQLAMQGVDLPHDIYTHIAGIDVIRNSDGDFYVLEDNLRCPSGVSYMLANRIMMMRLFPELFARQPVAPVAHYPSLLLDTLRHATHADNPCVVVLTPGRHNSAYYEHAFLAQQMGVELVEGADLMVKNDRVCMRTTSGLKPVDVIYRRIDDAFLDPLAFNPDSMLGVPGLLSVYRQGGVILANAMGTGIADDKSIYPYVLEHLAELVVKETHGAGGYGMLIGPKASQAEIAQFRERVKAAPHNYIAQPTLALSSCPTFVDEGIAPRHIDLRPFVLCGRETSIVPGGLTRVALREGSLVVNSSQGGGTKDTWVLGASPC